MAGAKHIEKFNCTAEQLFKVVSDYESYPKFLPEVKECKVIKTEGNKKLVEFKVSVIKSFTYRLWMNEVPFKKIYWTLESGEIFKTSNGSWLFDDLGKSVQATYEVDATFSLFVPSMITKGLLSVNLPTMMAAYHKRLKEIYK